MESAEKLSNWPPPSLERQVIMLQWSNSRYNFYLNFRLDVRTLGIWVRMKIFRIEEVIFDVVPLRREISMRIGQFWYSIRDNGILYESRVTWGNWCMRLIREVTFYDLMRFYFLQNASIRWSSCKNVVYFFILKNFPQLPSPAKFENEITPFAAPLPFLCQTQIHLKSTYKNRDFFCLKNFKIGPRYYVTSSWATTAKLVNFFEKIQVCLHLIYLQSMSMQVIYRTRK